MTTLSVTEALRALTKHHGEVSSTDCDEYKAARLALAQQENQLIGDEGRVDAVVKAVAAWGNDTRDNRTVVEVVRDTLAASHPTSRAADTSSEGGASPAPRSEER